MSCVVYLLLKFYVQGLGRLAAAAKSDSADAGLHYTKGYLRLAQIARCLTAWRPFRTDGSIFCLKTAGAVFIFCDIGYMMERRTISVKIK
jgi:hypothetical protein